jgi:hypothetical protein
MKNSKIRMLEVCCSLEDLIVVAAVSGYKKINEIRETLKYFMERANITSNELIEYQITHL